MKSTCLIVFAAAWLSALPPGCACAEEIEKTPEQLIEQLRSDDFDQRRDAAARLEKLGEPARAALERAAKDHDADMRASAARILARFARNTLLLYVRDSDGKPVANLEGELFLRNQSAQVIGNDEEPPGIPIKVGADGTASVKLDSAGMHNYQLKLPGFIAESAFGAVDARAGTNASLMILKRAGILQGSVLGVDGNPLKEAEVTIFSGVAPEAEMLEQQLATFEQMGMAGQKTMTDQDGKWRAENISEGTHLCIVKATGHKAAMSALIRVREGQTGVVPPIALAERKTGKLQLKVTHSDGKPLSKTGVQATLSFVDNPGRPRAFPMQNNIYTHIEKETDETGVLELDDLSPGKYQAMVRRSVETDTPGAVLVDMEVEIKPGETLRPEVKPRPKTGSIKGRIVTADGKGGKNIQVRLYSEREFLAQFQPGIGLNFPNVIFGNGPQEQLTMTDTNNKGAYRFDKVAPGKYAIHFVPNDGDESNLEEQGYIFGLEVQSEKKIDAPDAVLKAVAGERNTNEIKGRVLAPSGVPAVSAEVYHFAASDNQSTIANEDGTFDISLGRRGKHTAAAPAQEYLLIRYSGCKPFLATAPFQANKDYRLEKQDYGALRVTVTDEAGKPLPGVKVMPQGSVLQQLQPGQPFLQTQATNASGVVRLKGLAAGKREFSVQAPGYFLPLKNREVVVPVNAEGEVKLALLAGVRVAGRVRMPEGMACAGILARLNNGRCAPVRANGEFSFDGVTPGEYSISAVGEGVVMKGAVPINVPHDPQKMKAEPVSIELLRTGGIAIDCGKKFAGCSATLTPVGALEVPLNAAANTNVFGGEVDADGRGEFWNVPPGSYTLAVKPRELAIDSIQKLTAGALAGPFEVKPLESRAKLAALPAVKADLREGSGVATGRIRIPNTALLAEQISATLSLRVQSETASAESDLGDALEAFTNPVGAPVIVGTPPAGFQLHIPGTFEVSALPAGAYKVYAALNFYNINEDDDMATTVQERGKHKQIGTFTLKEGEKLDVGELKFDLGEMPKSARPDETLKSLLRPIDKLQEFEP